jgi:hypothetical protein
LKKIEDLKESIPAIDIFTEVSRKKPLGKGPSSDPFSHLPSDGHLEFLKRQLTKKADEILKKKR